MQNFYLIFFLLSPSLFSYWVEYFCSFVAPTNVSPYTLWVLTDTRVNFATDASEDRIRPLSRSILVI